MGYTHTVQKWNGKIFVQFESSSTSYYSMGAYMPGDDDIDEADVDTLGELYKLWQEAKAGDASCGEKGMEVPFLQAHYQGRKTLRRKAGICRLRLRGENLPAGKQGLFQTDGGMRGLYMIIKKGEREYSVTELSREWKAERVLGGVAVEYKIPKEAAPDAAAVERYIAENEIF